MPTPPTADDFLDGVEREFPAFAPALHAARDSHPDLYRELGDRLLAFSHAALGEETLATLVEGYGEFCTEVGRSQVMYEMRGSYEHASFDEVRKVTYDDDGFMATYNWGVFTTNFAWLHHLQVYGFLRDRFLTRIPAESKRLIDLGAGTGMWSLLTLEAHPQLTGTLVDISGAAVQLSRRLFDAAELTERVRNRQGDALSYRDEEVADAGLSFFLLEHLETPGKLLENLAENLHPGAPAFVVGGLTAAEVDHIYEFRRESELVQLAEDAGFRVLETFSAAPRMASKKARFLPRSMAMILERRRGEFW